MAGVDEVLRNLKKSNLLTPEQWKVVRREAAGAPSAGDAAIDGAGARVRVGQGLDRSSNGRTRRPASVPSASRTTARSS